jgi:hypothetical protein
MTAQHRAAGDNVRADAAFAVIGRKACAGGFGAHLLDVRSIREIEEDLVGWVGLLYDSVAPPPTQTRRAYIPPAAPEENVGISE